MTRSPLTTVLLNAITAVVFAILYGPILVPIASSFFFVSHGTVDWSQPSLGAYVALVSNERVLEALGNTLPIRLWAMMRLRFSPDINALVAGILAFTTVICLVAARFLMPRELSDSD